MNPEFHIHINGSYILPFLINRCILEVGVRNVPFNFSHGYSSRYAPHHHLSKKYSDIRKFKHDFDKLHYLLSNGDFEGYIEGEYVYLSENIGDIPLRSTDDFSFRLINSGCKAFRMSEVHLSLDFERSDKLLIDRLIGLGMFPCILPKVDYTAIMLSAQGNKKSIDKMTNWVHDTSKLFVLQNLSKS